jgi:hypothetical protein
MNQSLANPRHLLLAPRRALACVQLISVKVANPVAGHADEAITLSSHLIFLIISHQAGVARWLEKMKYRLVFTCIVRHRYGNLWLN